MSGCAPGALPQVMLEVGQGPRGSFSKSLFTRTKKRPSATSEIARRRSLRRSMSVKVTDFGANRKLLCNFLLANNTNLQSVSHRFQVITIYWSSFRFCQRVPLFYTLVQGESLNLRPRSSVFWKLSFSTFLWLHNATFSVNVLQSEMTRHFVADRYAIHCIS